MFKLFVNIACFKDPDLINTINDAFSKAKYPERIYIGVSEQSDAPNTEVQKIHNVRYKFTPSNFSKGTGWHRNEIYKELYDGEDFCLTVDSHCRFKYNWDDIYINSLLERGENVVLTGFPPNFDFDEDYDYYTSERAYNTYNMIEHLSDNFHMRGRGIGVQDDFKETAVVSGSNTFSSGAFTQLSLFNEYLHPFLDQEITSCMAFMYGHKVEFMREALVWHNYRNNSPGSKEKYRTLVSEEVKLTGYISEFVDVLNQRNSPRSATEWTQHILKFKK
jgi:hypothetical protein|tara:strand:+ start:1122 stop:1949 length:828 start_codon:yes stop_codon:yes gene_type:complete